MKTYVTIKEAAEFVGVSTKTIRRYVNSGVLVSKTVKGKRGIEYRLLKSSLLQHFRRIGYVTASSGEVSESEGETTVRLRYLVPKYLYDELKREYDSVVSDRGRLVGHIERMEAEVSLLRHKLTEQELKVEASLIFKVRAIEKTEIKDRLDRLSSENSRLLQEVAEKDTLIKILERYQLHARKPSKGKKSP